MYFLWSKSRGFVSEKLENNNRDKAKTIGSKTLQMKNNKNTLYIYVIL